MKETQHQRNPVSLRLPRLIGLVCLLLLITQASVAQTLKFSASKVTVKTAITEIKKQTNYSVGYSGKILNLNRQITVNKGSNTLRQIMNAITGDDLTYTINGRYILISKKQKQDASQPSPRRQVNSGERHSVKGTVTDAGTGEPLIGATVRVVGSSKGALTDVDGNYTMTSVAPSDEIEISYIGYKTRRQLVGDVALLNVQLSSADDQIGEVVVVGSGTQKKISVTGAITSIKGTELSAPSSSLTNNLAGKLAGVISSTSSGEPGSTSSFYIRGISTFGGRTSPLILLDGVEITSSDLNNIPPESIESFSILKDASATAIYGARGANGVMLITTKSGVENTKARINVRVESSMVKPVNMVDYADGATYMRTYNEAQLSRNPGMEARYSEETIERTANHVNQYVYPNVDWYDLMFRDYTLSQRANVNLTGGGSRVSYYMSIQANHDDGMLKRPSHYSINNNFNRWMYIFQNNIGYKVTKTTKLDLRMMAQIQSLSSPNVSSSSIFSAIYNNNPVTFPAVFPRQPGDTYLKFGSGSLGNQRYYTNPYANMVNNYRKTNANKLNITLNVDQKLDFITKGLSLTALVNFNNTASTYYTRSLEPYIYQIDTEAWNPDYPDNYTLQLLRTGTEYITESALSRTTTNNFYFDGRLNYSRSFGRHNVTGMLMYMMREAIGQSVLPHRNQGFSGRATYDYDNRYLFELNFGYNGTERLPKHHRFEFFPAVSLGWVVSGEKFWEPLEKYVDFLKLRASYGLVGSDETGSSAGAPHFLYMNSVSIGGGTQYTSGYTNRVTYKGSAITAYATINPRWERAKELNFGLDMRILGQINVTFDIYHNKRDRILMKRASFPTVLGYRSAVPFQNVGKVDNKGLELAVNWHRNLSKDWFVDLRGTFTYVRNKYVFIDEIDYGATWQQQTGKALAARYGYEAIGLFQSNEDIASSADQSYFGSTVMPGDIKYRDINGDGVINTLDRKMISPYGSTPRIQYGFGVSTTWKKLDFSVFFNGSAKRTILLSGFHPFNASDASNHRNLMQWIADSHWTEGADNSGVKYPRLGLLSNQTANNTVDSSWWLRCGNFLRFKTLEVGYSFPFVRIYFSGDNLAVWSPFKYWDPELAFSTYPLSRTLNIGAQFKF